jgi:nicotinamide-nucleotide amidase
MTQPKSNKVFAHIVVIGNELLIGQVIDTNSSFIALELNKIGVEVSKISAISDTEKDIIGTIKMGAKKSQIIITTGGLGPTKDDITKHSLAKMFGAKLVRDEAVYAHIKKLFATYNLPMNAYTKTQAEIPQGTIALPNSKGTAPGMWTKFGNCTLINLPGVPKEMKALMQEQVIPKIQQTFETPYIVHKTLLSVGKPESELAENLHEWEITLPKQIQLAYLPNGKRVRLRLSGYGPKKKEIAQLVFQKEQELIGLLGNFYEPYTEEPLQEQLYSLLKQKKLTLAVAESCTGGAISAKIVSQPGISQFFMGGVVAYSNEIKESQLKVKKETLKKFGAVSKETITEMATNLSQIFQTNIAIATSGIAPSPNIQTKEEGKIYIGIFFGGKTFVFYDQLINLTRNQFIDQVVERALKNLIQIIRAC